MSFRGCWKGFVSVVVLSAFVLDFILIFVVILSGMLPNRDLRMRPMLFIYMKKTAFLLWRQNAFGIISNLIHRALNLLV
jgi:hypothetical protein